MSAKKITKKKKKVIIAIVTASLTFLISTFVPESSPIKKGIIELINQVSSVIDTTSDSTFNNDSTYIY
jgi:hypothetical protein